MPETACSCQERGGIVFRNARCVLHGDDAIAATPLTDPGVPTGDQRWTVDEVDAVTEWLDDNVRTYGAMKPEWAVVKTEEYQRARELIVAVFRDAARVPALQALLGEAWGVIANASDWHTDSEQSRQWQAAARRWNGKWNALLDLLTEAPDGE